MPKFEAKKGDFAKIWPNLGGYSPPLALPSMGIPHLSSQKGVNWRLLAQDGEDDVDLVNRKYLKNIMHIAKKHDKVILNVYESATPSFLKTLKI